MKQPFISLLFLARGDLMGMIKTAHSYIDNCKTTEDIEFIVGQDYDDIFCINEFKKYQQRVWPDVEFRYLIFPERLEWAELYRRLNELYEESKGEWIAWASDDCCNLTHHWDQILKDRYRGKFLHVKTYVGPDPRDIDHPIALFPYTTRKFFDIMGHVSLNMQADLWMGQIAIDLGFVVLDNDLRMEHIRTRNNVPKYTCDKFYNEDRPLWEEDKRKVKEYLDKLKEGSE
tara:strand:- start:560 stop:1249 length:690 start_codon:yes stop_codon:yes gene_type:complete